jgi:hypothetical protein
LLETVVLVRCDGRSRLRHPSPPDDVDADICKISRKIYVSFFWGVRPLFCFKESPSLDQTVCFCLEEWRES